MFFNYPPPPPHTHILDERMWTSGAGGEEVQSDDGMSVTGAGKRKRRKAVTDQLTQQ